MTGATAVVWFLGRSRKSRSAKSGHVELAKPEAIQEARRAVQESAARSSDAHAQRGTVAKVVERLVEVRRNNHFAEGIRAAMGGEE